ncbi:hypothetical protein CGI26_03540 [Vibrio parahaemolyticus]|nr:hypothetical protein CGI26_03540 [Vibrio parahaemolyticus]
MGRDDGPQIFGGLTKNSVKWQQVKKQNLKIRRIGGVVSGAKFCLGGEVVSNFLYFLLAKSVW